jgi:hypothetical protein
MSTYDVKTYLYGSLVLETKLDYARTARNMRDRMIASKTVLDCLPRSP